MDISTQLEQELSVYPETDFYDQYNILNQVCTDDSDQSMPNKLRTNSIFEMLKQNIAVICLLVWLTVAVCLLIRKVTVYQSFVKYIKAG